MKKSRTAYSLINIFVGIGGYIVNTILGLVCRMVFTRTLTVDYLGINGLFSNILSVLSLAELGIGTAIVYALYKPLALDDKEKVASLVSFYGKCYRIIGLVVAAIGVCLLPFLDSIIKEQPNISENLRIIYLVYLFNTASTYFFSYRGSLLTAAQQNYIVTGLSYVITILQSIIQILLLYATHNYMLYLAVQTCGILIYNVTISWIAGKKYPEIKQKGIKPLEAAEKKGLITNVRALIVIKLSGMLVNNTDNIIISMFTGLAMVGYSSNYTLLSATLNGLLTPIFNGINASVGNLNAVESKEKQKQMFFTINLANFWLYAWAAIGIFVCSSDIVKLAFGAEYVLPINIPLVIALNFYIVGMQNAVWTYKNTLGLFRYGRYLLLITAAINLVCSIWLGRVWGLFGILIATAIARALTNVWYEPFAVFKYGLKEKPILYYKHYIEYAIILCVTAGACFFACNAIVFPIVISVFVKIVLCSIITNVTFWVAFHRREEYQYFKALFISLGQRIRAKLGKSAAKG